MSFANYGVLGSVAAAVTTQQQQQAKAQEAERQEEAQKQQEATETKEAQTQETVETEKAVQTNNQQRLLQLEETVGQRLEAFVKNTGKNAPAATGQEAEAMLLELENQADDSFTPENLAKLREMSQNAQSTLKQSQEAAKQQAADKTATGEAAKQDLDEQAKRASQELKTQQRDAQSQTQRTSAATTAQPGKEADQAKGKEQSSSASSTSANEQTKAQEAKAAKADGLAEQARQTAQQADVAKQQTAKQEAARQEAAKQDVAKAEAAKQDTAKADTAKATVSKTESAKAQALETAAKAEAAKQEAKTQAANNEQAKTQQAKPEAASEQAKAEQAKAQQDQGLAGKAKGAEAANAQAKLAPGQEGKEGALAGKATDAKAEAAKNQAGQANQPNQANQAAKSGRESANQASLAAKSQNAPTNAAKEQTSSVTGQSTLGGAASSSSNPTSNSQAKTQDARMAASAAKAAEQEQSQTANRVNSLPGEKSKASGQEMTDPRFTTTKFGSLPGDPVTGKPGMGFDMAGKAGDSAQYGAKPAAAAAPAATPTPAPQTSETPVSTVPAQAGPVATAAGGVLGLATAANGMATAPGLAAMAIGGVNHPSANPAGRNHPGLRQDDQAVVQQRIQQSATTDAFAKITTQPAATAPVAQAVTMMQPGVSHTKQQNRLDNSSMLSDSESETSGLANDKPKAQSAAASQAGSDSIVSAMRGPRQEREPIGRIEGHLREEYQRQPDKEQPAAKNQQRVDPGAQPNSDGKSMQGQAQSKLAGGVMAAKAQPGLGLSNMPGQPAKLETRSSMPDAPGPISAAGQPAVEINSIPAQKPQVFITTQKPEPPAAGPSGTPAQPSIEISSLPEHGRQPQKPSQLPDPPSPNPKQTLPGRDINSIPAQLPQTPPEPPQRPDQQTAGPRILSMDSPTAVPADGPRIASIPAEPNHTPMPRDMESLRKSPFVSPSILSDDPPQPVQPQIKPLSPHVRPPWMRPDDFHSNQEPVIGPTSSPRDQNKPGSSQFPLPFPTQSASGKQPIVHPDGATARPGTVINPTASGQQAGRSTTAPPSSPNSASTPTSPASISHGSASSSSSGAQPSFLRREKPNQTNLPSSLFAATRRDNQTPSPVSSPTITTSGSALERLKEQVATLDATARLGYAPVSETRSRIAQGAIFGGRPVTSNVPICSPVLDMLHTTSGKNAVDKASTPIKMVLSGSVGSLDKQTYTPLTPKTQPQTSQNLPTPQPSQAKLNEHRSQQLAQRSNAEVEPRSASHERVLTASRNNTLMGAMTFSMAKPAAATTRPRAGESAKQDAGETSTKSTSNNSDVNKVEGAKGRQQNSGEQGRGGQGGNQGSQTNPRLLYIPQQERLRMRAIQLTTSSESFSLTMSRMSVQAHERNFVIASQTIATPVNTLLKRIYRKQELDDLEETEAVNGTLLMLKMSGEFTYNHSNRVLEYAMDLADEMGIRDSKTRRQIEQGAWFKDIGEMGVMFGRSSPDKVEDIANFMSTKEMHEASLLHDIGELQIPNYIMHKPGKVTDEEYEMIKMHPIIGEEMIYPILSLRHLCPTIRGHHERWDGKGYPDGLKGRKIPLAARILAVADAFDALHTDRPYKESLNSDRARNLINEGRGTQFDPDCLDAFNRVLDRRFPTATRRRPHRQRLDTTAVSSTASQAPVEVNVLSLRGGK